MQKLDVYRMLMRSLQNFWRNMVHDNIEYFGKNRKV